MINGYEKKPSTFAKIAPMAGTVIGGAAGAFAGNPMLGAAIGGAAGNAAAGIANKDAGQVVQGAAEGVSGAAGASQSAAMARRLDTQNKLLSDAISAVPNTGAPMDMQNAMQRKLMDAAMKGQGVA